MEAQKRQQELVLRRKNEEVRHTKSHWRHDDVGNMNMENERSLS